MNRIWFNGKLREGLIELSPQDRGLTLGDGIFETILVLDNVALWRDEHLLRMKADAQLLGLAFPADEIGRAINRLVSKTETHHILRLTLTRGAGGRGLAAVTDRPTLVGTLTGFDESLQFQPIRLLTSTIERNLKSPTSSIKSLSYLDQIMAAREASAAGYDEALMFNTKGRVACCSIGNVFLVIGETLVTPSLYEGILNGIMRQKVIAAASSAGIAVKERLVRLADLDRAESMFITNSLRYIRPVTALDDRRFSPPTAIMQKILPILASMQRNYIAERQEERTS